ncbi:MAG: nucleotide exchange factor GrpE [Patescibacteria group bacterium]|nr:nucleotide exchange factor GrpE [Patescibacteria group bacterium]
MSEEKKYPKIIAGAFIFNDKDELLLTKGTKWHDKYVCLGGKIEVGEKIEETLRREAKEEANLEIENIEFINFLNGYDVNDSYASQDNHLFFLDYKAKAKNSDEIKLNGESSGFKWSPVKEWLKMDKKRFAPYVYEVLEKLEKKDENFEHKYLLALADYQNLLKRTAQEKLEFVKYANEDLIQSIIPVYDNLKISLAHVDETVKKNGWLEGIKHVIRQFKDVLESMGVEEIKTVGEKFDHNTMEAIEGKGEKVIKEVRPGYKLSGKVIVAAKVIVG